MTTTNIVAAVLNLKFVVYFAFGIFNIQRNIESMIAARCEPEIKYNA